MKGVISACDGIFQEVWKLYQYLSQENVILASWEMLD